MAVIPLHTATDGLIRAVTPELQTQTIATRGLLWDFNIDPQPKPSPDPEIIPGGGKGGYKHTYRNWKDKKNKDMKFQILKQEDEEIMAIIKSFIKCQ